MSAPREYISRALSRGWGAVLRCLNQVVNPKYFTLFIHTTHYTLHTSHYTLHTTHYTLHTTHYTLHSKYSTPNHEPLLRSVYPKLGTKGPGADGLRSWTWPDQWILHPAPKSQTQSRIDQTSNPRSQNPDPKRQTPTPKHQTPDTKHQIPDHKPETPNPKT